AGEPAPGRELARATDPPSATRRGCCSGRRPDPPWRAHLTAARGRLRTARRVRRRAGCPGPAPPDRVPPRPGGRALRCAYAGIAAVLILLAVGTLLWRRELPHAKADASAKHRPSPSPAPGARAVGYVTGRDRAETRRRAQAIERACSERGWTLARVVQEGHLG